MYVLICSCVCMCVCVSVWCSGMLVCMGMCLCVCLSVAVCDVSLCMYLCVSLCICLCVCLCLYMSVHEYVSVTVCLWESVYLCIFTPTATFLHFLPLGVRKHEAGIFQRLYFKLGGFMGLWRDPPGTKDEWRCGPLTGYWYTQTRHCHRKGRSHRCLAPPFFAGESRHSSPGGCAYGSVQMWTP